MADQPLSLHPDNAHYFLFRGRPAVLVTSGEHYGAVLNRDFDYVTYLDTLARDGLNLTRVFSGAYVEPIGAFQIQKNTLAPAAGRLICPWARSSSPGYVGGGNKFDLSRWDDAYFARLRDFVGQAGRRGIVVELVLFCTFYDDSMWKLSPMRSANNVNGIGALSRTEVYSGSNAPLQAVQEAMVRKIVRELREFDNVYYEVCNEPYERPGLTRQWNDRIIAAISNAEEGLAAKHLIAQGIAYRSATIREPNDRVSIFNFHAASPESVSLNYGLGKVIADDETHARGDPARFRKEAWQFLLAGGAVFDHLDLSFAVGYEGGTFTGNGPGGGPELRKQLGVLLRFMNSLDFVRMRPDGSVVQGGVLEVGSVHTLVERGQQYAMYHCGVTHAELTLDLAPGNYRSQWINTHNGRVGKSELIRHGGGPVVLTSPSYENDLCLRLGRVE